MVLSQLFTIAFEASCMVFRASARAFASSTFLSVDVSDAVIRIHSAWGITRVCNRNVQRHGCGQRVRQKNLTCPFLGISSSEAKKGETKHSTTLMCINDDPRTDGLGRSLSPAVLDFCSGHSSVSIETKAFNF